MIPYQQALALIAENAPDLPPETLPLDEAADRVAAESIQVPNPVPNFRQSAMDGYAVRADDLEGATRRSPVRLEVTGEIAAGSVEAEASLVPGRAIRIFTGAPLPEGADTVVRQENTRRLDNGIEVSSPINRGKDVRPPGEQYTEGSVLVQPGTRITEAHVRALAECGIAKLEVIEPPKIHFLGTGDEVKPVEEPLHRGEVHDANTPYVKSFFRRRGYPVETHHVDDDRFALESMLRQAVENADLVVTSGGVSVGDYDYLKKTAEDCGVTPIFWGVLQKPGKPLYFGKSANTALLGLPGNPYAVEKNAQVYLPALLDAMERRTAVGPTFEHGILHFEPRFSEAQTRWVFCRVKTNEDGVTELERPEPEDVTPARLSYSPLALAAIPPADRAGTDCVKFIRISRR